MRLDKYLKNARLIKRRTVAKEVCDAGRVTVNGRVAKAGTELAVGDVVSIRYGHRLLTVRVTGLQESARKDQAPSMYEVLADVPLSPQGALAAADDPGAGGDAEHEEDGDTARPAIPGSE
ncbi:hypothetical protein GCM10010885_17530 [Alicyclobacillus cellulosilyticus]|uniref:RQC P-site tRNA stabilizing factor n=1 Tax=Alicyclobacillus cellulosilyticus TaxID=1003997 RepID=A0A917KF67_9BACL|nr:hypothetical protein GCM10010885_17530 [Alicyclobacillus cellulosilyticus]